MTVANDVPGDRASAASGRIEVDGPRSTPATVADAMLTAPKLADAATTVGDLRKAFDDVHVHAALVVDGRILLAVVERGDLGDQDDGVLAHRVGGLAGRTVLGTTPLADAVADMQTSGRRRLAVVDGKGCVQGLLCLKRDGSGFCTDRSVQARAATPTT